MPQDLLGDLGPRDPAAAAIAEALGGVMKPAQSSDFRELVAAEPGCDSPECARGFLSWACRQAAAAADFWEAPDLTGGKTVPPVVSIALAVAAGGVSQRSFVFPEASLRELEVLAQSPSVAPLPGLAAAIGAASCQILIEMTKGNPDQGVLVTGASAVVSFVLRLPHLEVRCPPLIAARYLTQIGNYPDLLPEGRESACARAGRAFLSSGRAAGGP